MKTVDNCQLQVSDRVIWVNDENGRCVLRICRLGKEIIRPVSEWDQLDITILGDVKVGVGTFSL